MNNDVARLFARGVDISWEDKAKGMTTMNPFIKRIGQHLDSINADAYLAMLGQRLNELDTINIGLQMLRSIDCPILCPFICAVILASENREWGFPEMKPPFTDYKEKIADATFPLVDKANKMSLDSKKFFTALEFEREHVAKSKRMLGEALFIEQATVGPQTISIGHGEGDSENIHFALVYVSTDVDENKSVGSMTVPWREQLWRLVPVLEQDDSLMLFPPSVENIRNRVNEIFEGSSVTFESAALVRVVGSNLPGDRVLASPVRFFFAGSDQHVLSQENFSLMPYKSAQRRRLVDGSNVVLIRLNPWSKKPNDFASHVFENSGDSSDEIDPIVGDVLAVPECVLSPVVKEHLGLKQSKKSCLNIRLRIYDHVLLLAREAKMLREVARQVKMVMIHDGYPDPSEFEGLQVLPKVMFTDVYD